MRCMTLCLCALLVAPRAASASARSDLADLQQQQHPPTPPARPDSLPLKTLSTIVITATRIGMPLRETPAAISVVGAEALAAMARGIAVDETMRLVPGVKVDNQANGKRVHLSIRGQGILSERGIRGTKVILDGLPLNDPSGFATDFYDVDWSTVDRIEVVRGPGASLYGGGSSAGVLNIRTADGEAAPVSGLASGTYGSNGFWRATGDFGGSSGALNYRTSYTHTEGDGYRVHTAFHGNNVYAKAHWTPSAGVRLTPIVWYTDFFNQNAEGLNLTWLAQDRRMANPDALTFNEYQDTKRVVGGVVGEADLGHGHGLSFNGFVRHTNYEESVPSTVQHRSLLSPGATVQYTLNQATGSLRHHVALGTDLQRQDIDEYRRPNMGDAVEGPDTVSNQSIRQYGIGFFALDRIELGAGWGAMLNVRYDRVQNRLVDHLQMGGVDLSGDAAFDHVTGRAGITYAPTQALSLYASFGQGFLPPATEELANNPAQLGGFNQSLEAALSWGGEVGARGMLGGAVLFDVSLFQLHTDRDFDRYRVDTRPLETFYRNAGSSQRYGVESYVAWTPALPVVLQVAYTYSHFTYTSSAGAYGDINGHWLPNSPQHQLFADAQYSFLRRFAIGVSGEVLSLWYIDPTNVISESGYALVHARASYRLTSGGAGAELTFAVRNIFGKEYIAFTEPDPDGNSYQPAAEREFFVGMRLSR
jgi:iron complex outermembrane recepter protein